MVYMLFPLIKFHLIGSPVEIVIYSDIGGMLASVFLLGSLQLFLFFFDLGTCKVICVVELTSNLTLECISVMCLKWFFNHDNVYR